MEKRLLNIGTLVIVMFFMVACGEETKPQSAPKVSKGIVKTDTANAPLESEEKEIEKEYVYNALGKRDPFENPLRAIVEIASDTGVPLTPLQKYDLGQLRLIGVIVGKGDPRAMIIAPDGKSFILKVGTKVGKNNGAVVGISTEAVMVKERYFDFAGEVKTSVQEIRLPKQGGA